MIDLFRTRSPIPYRIGQFTDPTPAEATEKLKDVQNKLKTTKDREKRKGLLKERSKLKRQVRRARVNNEVATLKELNKSSGIPLTSALDQKWKTASASEKKKITAFIKRKYRRSKSEKTYINYEEFMDERNIKYKKKKSRHIDESVGL
jgi:hypothetical protein